MTNPARRADRTPLGAIRVAALAVAAWIAATHALPIAWARRGWVHGLRIDHPDGLRDPGEYFRRLREACPDAWIVAEKILESGEQLPADWPIAGTPGYDFLNHLGDLFVDPRGEEALTRLHEEVTGQPGGFAELAHASKRQVLDDLLGSEVSRLVRLFVAVCERHRRHRDYTRRELRAALTKVAVHFPVYRLYVSAATGAVGETDVRHVEQAIEAAIEATPDVAPELFRFLRDLLLRRHPGSLPRRLLVGAGRAPDADARLHDARHEVERGRAGAAGAALRSAGAMGGGRASLERAQTPPSAGRAAPPPLPSTCSTRPWWGRGPSTKGACRASGQRARTGRCRRRGRCRIAW